MFFHLMTYGILLASDHGVRAALDKFEHYFTNLFRGTFGIFRGKKGTVHHTEGTTYQHTVTNTPKTPSLTLSHWITGTSTSFKQAHRSFSAPVSK